ncbi:acetoin utilization protein AcuC [Dactylosporangium aurantiacum]|uniref:Acetoin utilization protein AcuC n=1 Tax=Dactylosporangium aurantiacum TaxID=35754 RepID=A0A9Q9IQH7_9ACTN|nr:acetoin utilization protein AcuC [Dactylosporangium aurantiacum]MDG6104603.1 acetoin utilization protein AcuC [Dactylosporangium aurantiacum]UWZ59433.1 acetoin utilization protein AcuC [Dactylosporangium aurantiacum]
MWDDALLRYDMGEHPLDPVRVELTMALARDLGILAREGVTVRAPQQAGDEVLGTVHDPDYIAVVKAASTGRRIGIMGLGTTDNPTFTGMHEASALIAGATRAAAEAVWLGEADRAVSIAGGLHHAMPARAAGFCVYNDPAVAIARVLELGAERVAYVDIDVHHGDGVQEIFYDDPRVLTVSLHESPRSLFPGTGFPEETGGPGAEGSAVNVALPPGTDDAGWLRAFHAVVPGVLRAFRPQLLFTQCGADTYRHDPLANLRLTVDGQRAAYLALRALAEEVAGGKWVASGGGGYALVECVPRAWTHLLAVVTGDALDPATVTPPSWRALAAARRPGHPVPTAMTDGGTGAWTPWVPGQTPDAVDRAVMATRAATFPFFGLDPHDPRD